MMIIIIAVIVIILAVVGIAVFAMGSSSGGDMGGPVESGPVPVVASPQASGGSDSDSDSPSASAGGKIYGPLDDIGDDRNKALGAYSIRHLYSKYDGPIFKVQRVAGGGQRQAEDIFQKTKGGPLVTRDGTEISSWLGTGQVGQVIIWYDQSKKEHHITMQSGYPKIEQDNSMSGKGKYNLVFKNTKIIFNKDPMTLKKYPNLRIVSNTNIFKGSNVNNRQLDGTITDLFFFDGNIESGAIDELETSKKKLYLLNPDPNIF